MRSEGKKLREVAALLARGELRIPDAGEDRAAPEDQITQALAAVGLYPETPLHLESEFALWPECVPIFQLYCSVQTQWVISAAGKRIGLNYAGVEAYMNMHRIPAKRRAELLDGIQVMEFGALTTKTA